MHKFNYGFSCTEIIIKDTHFIKKAKNIEGINKINNEIAFYKHIIDIDYSKKLPMPKFIYSSNDTLVIEYINNSKTLTQIINKNNYIYYLEKIKYHIKHIHDNKISVNYNTIVDDICIEIENKILNRYNKTKWEEIPSFIKIKKVNGIFINNNIKYYIDKIKINILTLIKNEKIKEYNLIHGDIHLGNILLDEHNKLYFIDPRGYFGNTKLFGLKQYDYAKLLFGLSGYSSFDNMQINTLCINNDNIEINFINQYEYIFDINYFDRISVLLALSIWLGNSSCFLDINKKITSLMIAYFYCEKYL